jgi:hypothetical protein
MEMIKMSKEEKIILDIHRLLFRKSIPSSDYDELIKNERTNYKNYSLSIFKYNIIVEEFLTGKKLTALKKAAIRSQLNLSETLPDIKRL